MPTYQTIHTNYGLAAMAAAESTGVPINLTHMAVGDGNGSDVTPVATMTALVNERYRTTVNRVQQDPANPSKFYVEMLIPAATGGWTIREFGIFDSTGALFAVGNFPATYKTVPTDGATNDLVIRTEIVASNASIITIQIDPNVAVASQAWVTSTITRCYLLPGGTTGQILRKVSNVCGDTEWANPTDVNVIVDVVQEIQTVTANPQLTFNLATVTTNGLTVHAEGALLPRRSGAGGWQQGSSETQVVLGTQYPIGTEVVFLQNEPANNLPTPLERSLNLSDLANVATARTNLDVYNKAETDQKAPAGMVAHFARNTAPTGWLKANGALVSRTTYATLFAAIGTTFNVGGEPGTDFRLPDLRGEFLRGWDDGRGVDSGRAFGSFQGDELRSHTHNFTFGNGTGGAARPDYDPPDGNPNNVTTAATESSGGAETRPRNRALLACVKF